MTDKQPGTQVALTSADFMPIFEIDSAIERRNAMVKFTQQIMVEGTDYGKIPGVDKPSLLKPGAEKLVTFFGMSPEFTITGEVEDWTGADHKGEAFFYYRYKCRLTRNGRLMGEGEGSANSWETKYRYRWVPEDRIPAGLDKSRLEKRDSSITEFTFAIDKAETAGQYGKPLEYWTRFHDAIREKTAVLGQKESRAGKKFDCYTIPSIAYRVPNTEIADVVNTLQKMSQKRALVAATLIAVNASEYYTQDVEDLVILDVTPHGTVEPAKDAGGSGASAGDVKTGEHIPAERKPDARKTEPLPKGEVSPEASAAAMAGFREGKVLMTFKEAKNMAELTRLYNELPVEHRRPGTKVHEAFMNRRDEFAAKKGAAK